MTGVGPKNADVIVVTPSPSRGGEPRQILDATLKVNDLTEHTYVTSLVKCRTPGGRAPEADEIKACQKYLDREITRAEPEYVITLGVPPTKTLFRGKAKINQFHGEFIENDKVNYVGMPTFDPAYTVRDPSKRPGFDNDIRRLAEEFYGEAETEEVIWNVVRRGNLDTFLDEFKDADEFAFDCETSGLFQYGGFRYITAICIALNTRTWVIPGFMHPDFQDRSSSPWRHGDALGELMRLLFYMAKKGKKKAYAWNGKFDNVWLQQMFGGQFRLDFDGMLASHVLDENTSNDLTTNCRTFLGVAEYDIPLHQKNGKLKRGEKASTNWKYCAEDGAYTLRLVQLFRERLAKDKPVERLFYNLTMPAARAMEKIEMRGITLDRDTMEEQGKQLQYEKEYIEKKLNKLAGRVVNWNAPMQVAKVLFEDLGLKATIKTAKGKPSTSEDALLDLMGKHKVVDLLLKYREKAKFLSTYIEGFQHFMVKEKLYVSYKLHGTVTGRYSSRIHSIPRDGSIRNLVTAPDGWKFVQGDVSQAELRIAAGVSGDKELIRCFSEGTDVHWRTLLETLRVGQVGNYADLILETANALLRELRPDLEEDGQFSYSDAIDLMLEAGPEKCIEVEGGWKEGRKKAKAINFGFIYGMFENKFILTAKSKYQWEPTLQEAKLARSTYFNLYHGIKTWHEKQKKLARLDGSVRCLSGRLRRLPAINSRDKMARSEAERQAINSPIQGFIGDYKAMVMVEIEETIDKSMFRLVGEHHDAVLGEVREGCEEKVLPQVLAIMRKPRLLETLKVRLDIPMDGELEVGPWGKGIEFKEVVYNQ